jgi:Amiloride-sensitive sodium channel
VHGITYVFDKKLHPFERVLWLGFVAGTCYGAYYIGLKQYERFDANPTVISLERDYRDWNGTLPAITICYHKRVDETRAQEIIKRLWSVEKFDEDYAYFMNYIYAVVNINESYSKFNSYVNDKRLDFINMLTIAKEVHPTHNSIISSFDTNAEFLMTEIITEKGICYNVNSILSPLISSV